MSVGAKFTWNWLELFPIIKKDFEKGVSGRQTAKNLKDITKVEMTHGTLRNFINSSTIIKEEKCDHCNSIKKTIELKDGYEDHFKSRYISPITE